jgi:hypothetical protein
VGFAGVLRAFSHLRAQADERSRFLASLDVTDNGDQDIVVYLAEVVKLQQVAAAANLAGSASG